MTWRFQSLAYGLPALQLITRPPVRVVSTCSEHRGEGDGGLSQRDGILGRKFSYAADVLQPLDPPKRAIGRRTMDGGCLCALTMGLDVLIL